MWGYVKVRLRIVYMLTAGTPANGGRRTPADSGGRADIPAGGGQADALAGGGHCAIGGKTCLSHATGEGGHGKGPHRGGREDVSISLRCSLPSSLRSSWCLSRFPIPPLCPPVLPVSGSLVCPPVPLVSLLIPPRVLRCFWCLLGPAVA
jgi:hypothetical protein